MRTLLFLHGAGAAPDDPPRGRIEAALGPGWQVIAPALGEPDAKGWVARIDAALADLPADTVVVGHSLGGSSFLQCLALRRPGQRLAGFVGLACPFWGEPGWEYEEFYLPEGFAAALEGLGRLVFHHSRDDEVVDVSHLEVWKRHLPRAEIRVAEGAGHGFDRGEIGAVVEDARGM